MLFRSPGLDVAGLVVRGRGRHFSAGADVPRLCRLAASRAPDTLDVLAANSAAFTSLERLPYPTVAAIDGVCLGSGLELALACRWRIATPSALFASPEAEFGLIPGCGGSVRLPERIGTGAALDLFLSARHLDAEEAFRLGLVDALLPRADLGPAASRLVRRLALQEGRAA